VQGFHSASLRCSFWPNWAFNATAVCCRQNRASTCGALTSVLDLMWKLVTLFLGLPVMISCAAINSREDVDCRASSQVNATYSPVDSGIYGSPTRMEPSYRSLEKPGYPAVALSKSITGTVYVHVWIEKNHAASKCRIERVNPAGAIELTEGLAETICSWQFNPVEIHGDLIASEVIVPVKFSIKNNTSPPLAESLPPLPTTAYVLETISVEGSTP
ncbi:MAG: TonB family protein, partial [Caldilineaceae bacterium]|nr:TonB family protein [Caldilineaceae bacterium]